MTAAPQERPARTPRIWRRIPRVSARHDGAGVRRCVLEDQAEVAEADRGVDALRHRCGLQARGGATTADGVVQERDSDRSSQSTAAGMLERADVVDAAVAVQVERQTSRDVLSGAPRYQNVEAGVGAGGEETRGQLAYAPVLGPIGPYDIDCGPGPAHLIQCHPHRS